MGAACCLASRFLGLAVVCGVIFKPSNQSTTITILVGFIQSESLVRTVSELAGRRQNQTAPKEGQHGRAGRQHDRRPWREKRARSHPAGFRARRTRERAESRIPRTISKKLEFRQQRRRLRPRLAMMALPKRRLNSKPGAGASSVSLTATATAHQATAR